MADYAIHDTTLTDIADTIRKKDATAALIDPAEYADRINLMGMLEEKTVSNSNCVSFSDGADDVPIKSVIATIDSYYSGATYTKFVRTGKNLAYISGRDTTNGYQNNAYVDVWTGQSQYKSGWYSSEYVPCPENTIMTLSGIDNSAYTDAEMYISLGFYTETKQFISGVAYIGQSYNWPPTPVPLPFTFTTPRETFYVRFSVHQDFENTLMFETGSSASQYEQPLQALVYDVNLGAGGHRAGAVCDLLNGEGEESGVSFTFTPMPETCTLSGYNNIFCWCCETAVVYRSSGTVQPVTPTLISKSVVANGTYEAEDDNADGYDEVTVNVPPYSFMPTWTETKLVDNSGLATSFTFSEDYHNFQMLRVVIYNSSTQIYDSIFVLPSGIDKAFTYSSNKFCVNQQITGYSNQYVTYQEDSLLSWSRTGNRNCNIYEIYGMTFTNATLTTEVIYTRDAIANSNVTPTPPTGKTFFDYDAIIYMCCTTDTNITHFCKWWITKPKISLFTDSVGYGIPLFAYNAGKPVVFTETSIGTYGFFYVVGLNFTIT